MLIYDIHIVAVLDIPDILQFLFQLESQFFLRTLSKVFEYNTNGTLDSPLFFFLNLAGVCLIFPHEFFVLKQTTRVHLESG